MSVLSFCLVRDLHTARSFGVCCKHDGALRRFACCRGFGLPAKWVIHTVGPIYSQYSKQEAASLLADAHK